MLIFFGADSIARAEGHTHPLDLLEHLLLQHGLLVLSSHHVLRHEVGSVGELSVSRLLFLDIYPKPRQVQWILLLCRLVSGITL